MNTDFAGFLKADFIMAPTYHCEVNVVCHCGKSGNAWKSAINPDTNTADAKTQGC